MDIDYKIEEVSKEVLIIRGQDNWENSLKPENLAHALAVISETHEVITTTLFTEFEACVVTIRSKNLYASVGKR